MFGPAQRLHGATFVVDATFRHEHLDDGNIVVGIGLAAQELGALVSELNYRNLDDEPDFDGMNTSTEFLAKVIADGLADRIHEDALGAVRRRASPAMRSTAVPLPVHRQRHVVLRGQMDGAAAGRCASRPGGAGGVP